MGEEREANTEEKREAMGDDVEGHGMLDSPNLDSPNLDRSTDEGDDVEGHMLSESPNLDSPNAD